MRSLQKVVVETTSLVEIKHQKRSNAGLMQMDQPREELSKCCRIFAVNIHLGCLR